MEIERREAFRGCLLGLACGDAVGTTVEFRSRGSFPPVREMVGGGPFRLPPGAWTDDTSMALCLAHSLIECGGFDPGDQMRRYLRWWREGYMSSTGYCFDIGNTVRTALQRFRETGEPFSGPTHPGSAGNGSLMRLAPVPMYFAADRARAVHYAAESSRTTHGCTEAVDACRLFADMLVRALRGDSKEDVLLGAGRPDQLHPLSIPVRALAQGLYRDKKLRQIRSGGYVVESLEAALWCFWRSEDFEEAVLAAVNLGDDADTTGAICGQIAGAHYGREAIPAAWLERLVLADEIGATADALADASSGAGEGPR